jgi:hypothetical protein
LTSPARLSQAIPSPASPLLPSSPSPTKYSQIETRTVSAQIDRNTFIAKDSSSKPSTKPVKSRKSKKVSSTTEPTSIPTLKKFVGIQDVLRFFSLQKISDFQVFDIAQHATFANFLVHLYISLPFFFLSSCDPHYFLLF